jgi:copper chaperone
MYELKVSGMTCGGCVRSVEKAVHLVDPIAKVVVDLPTQTVKVESAKNKDVIATAIEEAGYPIQK